MKTVAIVVLAGMLTACGTVAGFGNDIQKSAEWTRDKMSGTKLDSTK